MDTRKRRAIGKRLTNGQTDRQAADERQVEPQHKPATINT